MARQELALFMWLVKAQMKENNTENLALNTVCLYGCVGSQLAANCYFTAEG